MSDNAPSSDGPGNAPVGDSPASPAAPVTTPAAKPTMVERLRSHRAESAARRNSLDAKQPDARDGTKVEPTADATPASKEEKPTKGKREPDTVPMAAFKERIARASQQSQALRDQVYAKDLELSKAREAFGLLQQELDRIREGAGKGEAFDPRDEQIRSYEVEKQVREITERLNAEHSAKIEQAKQEARLAEMTEQVASEIDDALAEFPLVGRHDLIAAMRENPSMDGSSVAKALHEQRLESAKKYLVTPKPPAPVTASPSAGGIQQRFDNSREGMTQRLRALRESRG